MSVLQQNLQRGLEMGTSDLIAGILAVVLGVVFYILNIKGKLKKANDENALLRTEKEQTENVYRFEAQKETAKNAEESYRQLRDRYLESDDDGDGPKSA